MLYSHVSLNNRSLLGESQRHLYDCYKRLYAEMLFRWNLLVPRSKILKYLSVNTEIYRDVEYVTECTICSRVTKAPLCKEFRKPLLKCVICRLPVKGLANACLNCGHGGHTLHMQNWFSVNAHSTLTNFNFNHSKLLTLFVVTNLFQKNEYCATGCGCPCLSYIFK